MYMLRCSGICAFTIQHANALHDGMLCWSCCSGWTSVPGHRMDRVPDSNNVKSLTIQGSRMEFVVNNGHNDWDTPSPYSKKPGNYVVDSPGMYRLKSGRLERIKQG